jgi:hypothetical protein
VIRGDDMEMFDRCFAALICLECTDVRFTKRTDETMEAARAVMEKHKDLLRKLVES